MTDVGVSKAERLTVAEEVYRALKRDVITLQHRPGASLTEQELATTYGSSRVPVREACRRLQQEGLLTAVPYKGYFVNHISLKDISDCFDLRLLLESHALKLATEKATDADLDRLESLAMIEYTFNDWSSYADFLDANLEFHVQLAALSRNERLVTALSDLISAMQRFFFLGLDLDDFASEMRNEHEVLVALIREGSSTEVIECLGSQIKFSRDRVLRAVANRGINLPLE
jgi:DNA-binding GntR family transcriptional regulator